MDPEVFFMRMYDIIHNKRNGEELSDEEIKFFVDGYTAGSIPDYQAAALAMAIYFRGMSDRETVCLTKCIAESGDTVDLSRFGTLSVDKHSTGGVGDKTSLIVAPTVAALGAKVAKMSGRGLGHTGGTVDKLEAIPGYRTTISSEEFLNQVEKIGIALIGQSGNLTPADKKLYALRDVTAPVDHDVIQVGGGVDLLVAAFVADAVHHGLVHKQSRDPFGGTGLQQGHGQHLSGRGGGAVEYQVHHQRQSADDQNQDGEQQQEKPADDSSEYAAFFLLFRRLYGNICLGRIAVLALAPAGRSVLHISLPHCLSCFASCFTKTQRCWIV